MTMINCDIGEGTKIIKPTLVNMYGCKIGKNCKIAPFTEIQSDVVIGDNTTISSHSFICSNVRIGDNCFIGHGVMFVNDRYPPRHDPKDWEETIIGNNVSIGSNATIMPVKIGDNSMIGAGMTVTKDVPKGHIARNEIKTVTRKRDEEWTR